MATQTIKSADNVSGAGYCKMPDGTLIQWGRATPVAFANGVCTKAISFPLQNAFISAPSVTASLVSSDVTYATANVIHAEVNTATVRMVMYAATTYGGQNEIIMWIAVGRWK